MKHVSFFRTGIVALALVVFVTPFSADAALFRSGDHVTTPAGITISDDLYMAGGNVSSNGNAEGDVIIGGGSVLISGPVAQDLMIGGGTVIVTGNVGDDARIAGGNVVLQSSVSGDALIGGGQVSIAGGGIGGDTFIGGGVVSIDAPIGGDVRVGGGEVVINAAVAGNVRVEADTVTLGPAAVIEGNFSYRAKKEATIADGAVIRGETTYDLYERRHGGDDVMAGILAALTIIFFVKFLMVLAAALVIGLFFKRYLRQVVELIGRQPAYEFGWGIVFAIVAPVASCLLMATIIGIPLGLLGFFGFAALMLLATLITPVIIGTFLHSWFKKPDTLHISWKTILLGVVAAMVLSIIPLIGWAVKLGVVLLTFGALIHTMLGWIKRA